LKTHEDARVNLSEDPKASTVALIGIVGAVLTFVAIVWLQAYFVHAERSETEKKLLARPPQELARLRAEQLEALHSYRWVDEPAGVVSIPIDEAMKIVAREAATGGGSSGGGAAAVEARGVRP
jgi:hypothetical protein